MAIYWQKIFFYYVFWNNLCPKNILNVFLVEAAVNFSALCCPGQFSEQKMINRGRWTIHTWYIHTCWSVVWSKLWNFMVHHVKFNCFLQALINMSVNINVWLLRKQIIPANLLPNTNKSLSEPHCGTSL